MDCDHDSFRLPWMYRAQTPCNLTRRTLGVKPPSAFLDDGTTLSLNPGKMKSQGKKKWYVTSSRTHIKGSKSYQMNRVRERKRARQTQCSRKMGQIAWTLILRDQNIPLGFEGDGASRCVQCTLQNDEAASLHYKMHAVINYCMKFQRPSRKHGI